MSDTERQSRCLCNDATVDESRFWQLIEESRAADNLEERATALSASLRRGGIPETVGFSEHLDRCLDALYTWDLWAVAYLAQGGCSDDGFEYFRCWIIAQGQSSFTLASKDPVAFGMIMDLDTDEADREYEELLYVAVRVFEDLTGTFGPNRSAPSPSSPAGDRWAVDDLAMRYPDLAARWS